jgi:hypothetical protein
VEPAREKRLSPIDLGFRLRTEALDLILQNDALQPRAGPAVKDGYLFN